MRNGCQWCMALLLVAGCGGAPAPRAGAPARSGSAPAGSTAPETPVARMTAAEARAFLAAHPEALVLDVRNPDEWDDAYGHLEGARQIPLPELASRVDEVAGWKDKPVLLVCRSGRRSGQAAELLRAAGYRHPINLEGGMIGWRSSEPHGP